MENHIKVCPDPSCEAVWHNCPKKHTKCNDCGGNVMKITEKTFWKSFRITGFNTTSCQAIIIDLKRKKNNCH